MKNSVAVCLFLLLSLTTPALTQSNIPSYNQPQISNMIDDAISKTVDSIVQIDPSISKIAIWNLETGQSDAINITLVEEKLSIALIKAGNYRRFDVMDRTALEIQAEEHNLSLPRVFDRRKMMKVGRTIGIHGFINGSVALVDDKLVFNLKLIDTETGAFAWADEIEGKDQDFINKFKQEQLETKRTLERQIASKKLKSGTQATLRSLILPGLGQLYIEENSHAFTYLFIEAVAWGVFTQAVLSQDDSADTRKFIGIGIIGLNHLVSSIDAAISTENYNQRTKEKYNLSLTIYPQKQVKLSYRF